MYKLKGKYTSYQANCLSVFMKDEIGCTFGLYNDKPTILIGNIEYIDGFKPFEDPIEDIFFDVYAKDVDKYTKKLTDVLNYLYENIELDVYTKIVVEPKHLLTEEDKYLSRIYAIFENGEEDFVLYNEAIDYDKDKNNEVKGRELNR